MILTSHQYNKLKIKIPLNSLVFDFHNSLPQKVDYLKINDNEFLSFKKFINGIYNGRYVNFICKDIVKQLFLNQIDSKLFLGNRVIISDVINLDEDLLKKIILMGCDKKLNMYFLLNSSINKSLENYIKNYGIIIKRDFDKLLFCRDMVNDDEYIKDNFSGITVIGDVHGQKERMLNAFDWARKNDNLIILLGDIVNYGPHSLECVEIVYDYVIRNKAILVLGNHERKLFKILNGENVYMNEAVKQTIDKIESLKENEKKSWIMKFNTLINLGKIFFRYKNSLFCHGGFVTKILFISEDSELNLKERNFCLFGDQNVFREKNYRKKEIQEIISSGWIKEIPENYILFLGHNTISNHFPCVYTNEKGGKIYFMDTGCGKGGVLTSADLRIINDKVCFKNFNLW